MSAERNTNSQIPSARILSVVTLSVDLSPDRPHLTSTTTAIIPGYYTFILPNIGARIVCPVHSITSR